MSQQITLEDRKLIITRMFAVPVERVFQAWTDPAIMAKWWSCNERWRTPIIDVENVPGGKHCITMRHSDGDAVQMDGKYVEIIANEKIVFTWTMSFGENPPEDTVITVDFKKVTGGTYLTLTHDKVADPEVLKGASGGWAGFMGMLEGYLERDEVLLAPGS